ncbi:MAG: hypothetical protein MHM6MM_008473 [Cercozoa sp. M6MM]
MSDSTQKPLTFKYFKLRARGEAARIVLALAGDKCDCEEVNYDVPFFSEEGAKAWAENRQSLPFGKVPSLEVRENGTVLKIPETGAITGFLARRYGLAGQNAAQNAACDALVIKANDIMQTVFPAVYLRKTHTAVETLREADHPSTKGLRELEGYLQMLKKEHNSLIFDSLTVGDIAVYCLAEGYFQGLHKDMPEQPEVLDVLSELFPSVRGTFDVVRAHPDMQSFLQNREI